MQTIVNVNAGERQAQEKLAIEHSTLGHMMILMMEQAKAKQGFQMRMDVVEKLNTATAVPLKDFDYFTVRKLAKQIDELSITLLKILNPDDYVEALYCCAAFTLHLVDEGFFKDATNMAVLVALMLMSDLEDDSTDTAGNEAFMAPKRRLWAEKCGALHTRAALMGYYNIR